MESEFPEMVPRVAGIRLNEATGSAVMLTLTAAGFALAHLDQSKVPSHE